MQTDADVSETGRLESALFLARLWVLFVCVSLGLCLSECRHAWDWVFHVLSMASIFDKGDGFRFLVWARACHLLGVYCGLRAFFASRPSCLFARIAGAGSACAIVLAVGARFFLPDVIS